MSFFQFALSNILGFIVLLLVVLIPGLGILHFVRLFVFKSKTITKTKIDLVRYLGIFALVYGFLFQIIGMVGALEAVINAADISPQLILQGLAESFKVPMIGMILFLISLVFWYANKTKWKINAQK